MEEGFFLTCYVGLSFVRTIMIGSSWIDGPKPEDMDISEKYGIALHKCSLSYSFESKHITKEYYIHMIKRVKDKYTGQTI